MARAFAVIATCATLVLMLGVLRAQDLSACIRDNGSDAGIAWCLDLHRAPCEMTRDAHAVHDHREC